MSGISCMHDDNTGSWLMQLCSMWLNKPLCMYIDNTVHACWHHCECYCALISNCMHGCKAMTYCADTCVMTYCECVLINFTQLLQSGFAAKLVWDVDFSAMGPKKTAPSTSADGEPPAKDCLQHLLILSCCLLCLIVS